MNDKQISREKLEEHMEEHLVHKAPFQVPPPAKQLLVLWAPWIALISGAVAALSVIGLWTESREILGTSHTYYNADGDQVTLRGDVGVFYYFAMIALAAQSVLMLRAYKGLKARSKMLGWNVLLYAILASVAYNVLLGLSKQGHSGNFVFAFLTAVVGLYFLAQIKPNYHDEPKIAQAKSKPRTAKKKKSTKKATK